MTNLDIQQAREWAEEVGGLGGLMPGPRVAVEVIQSLPDRWVDAEKLEELLTVWRSQLEECDHADGNTVMVTCINDLAFEIPTPSLPTLAELIEAGNDPQQYQWMQAESVATDKRFGSHGVITAVNPQWLAPRRCMLLAPDGFSVELPWDEVIPAVDEPKLEFPSLFLSGESEDVSLETETNTEGADTIPDQVVAKDACNNTVPQSGDVWQAVWLDRAGILVVGKGIHHESGSPQGYFFMDHDPQVRWVGTDEVDLTKLVLRRGQ